MTTDVAIVGCVMIAAIGIIIDSAEFLAARHQIARAFRWDALATMVRPSGASSPVARAVSSAFIWNGVAFHVIRISLATAALLAAAAGSLVGASLATLLLLVMQMLLGLRLGYGMDGADQMYTMVLAGISLTLVSHAAGLAFVAGHSLLSYWISGVAKLAGEEWRSGRAPAAIVSTVGHGSEFGARIVGRFSRPLAYTTMGFEVAGPFLVAFGPVGGVAFGIAALGFHVSIATVMGLNNFVWAFGSALPAVVWLSTLMA